MELESVKKLPLGLDGITYTGWGYCENNSFIPHGCGKKYYSDYYVYGNYEKGILSGPALKSYNYYMYAMQCRNNEGNGWGLCINRGALAEFGYYKDSKIKNNLTSFVDWYYHKMETSGRRSNMLNMYTFKQSHAVSELLIGYEGTVVQNGCGLTFMGFRFKADGSVWVGNTESRHLTGMLLHFKPNGCIDAGLFNDGVLQERMELQDIIDAYYGSINDGFGSEDNIITDYNYFSNAYDHKVLSDSEYMMPYYIYEYSLKQDGKFKDFGDDEVVWGFDLDCISTPYGQLDISSVQFIDNGTFVGVQFDIEGDVELDFDDYKTYDIGTLALVRRPNNAWLWAYLFNKEGKTIVTFCGREDYNNGLDEYIRRLKARYITPDM